ncbi:MAG: endolytic transglycosylase MltG [bacterium]|nr:endolytic transglycosylase MltG [bacterium]
MKRITVLMAFVLIIILVLFLWWRNGLLAVNSSGTAQKIFIIQKGQGIREIANKLKSEGFIKDSIIFFLLVKKMRIEGKIQAGDFRLSSSMTPEKIAETFTHGTLDVWITIPEGKRATEIDEILKENIPSYKPSWKIDLVKNEGYLFPDTYLIPKDAEINLILSIMKTNFEKKFNSLNVDSKNKLSKNEIVIIASLIEREAKFPNDRPLISSVIRNRLDIDMALQIDATVQYALGFEEDKKTWWRKELTIADLKIDSPFNTYKNIGLPPSPISNPGISSLEAAANPARTDYLYYMSDKNGITHYAKTLEEHNLNIKKYGL